MSTISQKKTKKAKDHVNETNDDTHKFVLWNETSLDSMKKYQVTTTPAAWKCHITNFPF